MSQRPKLSFDQDVAKFTPRQMEAIQALDSGLIKFLLYGGALGGGKIVSNSSHLLTPFGWKSGKDIKAGDTICNPEGTHQKIIQIKPAVTLPAWHLFFHDGSKITVAEDHLWKAWRSGRTSKHINQRKHGSDCAKIVETKTLCEWLDKAKDSKLSGNGQPPWPLIPVCEEQHFNITLRYKSWLPPYILGVLLGDGCISNKAISITCHIDDLYNIENALNNEDFKYSVYDQGTKASIRFIGETNSEVIKELTRLGLHGTKSHTKFIPREFLFGTVKSRYALLSGLMDTDGTIGDGRVSYCSTSLQLAEDVRHIVRSLGGIVTLTDKDPWYYSENRERIYCKKAYILYIKHRKPEKLFRLERKKTKAMDKRATPMYLRLVDYKVEGEVTGRCITVDNPNGLYITDDFIVTHNSYFLRWCAARLLMRYFLIQGLKWVQVMLACEDYPSLKDRQLTKIAREFPEWLGTSISDHKNYGRCFILSPEYGNGVICFRNLDDASKYQSSEFAAILVDELTKNDYDTFTFLRTRLRWPGLKDIECPFIGGTNPGGIGHGWTKQFWMDKVFPDEFIRPIDYRPQFAYIPSKADDNPHLDSSYWAMLDTLPLQIRKAFRDGDWNIFVGQAFQEFSEPVHVIEPLPIPNNASIYMTFDWGFGAPFSIGWWWVDADGRVYRFAEWYGWDGSPNKGLRIPDSDVVKGLIEREKTQGITNVQVRYAGPDCFQKKPDYKGGGQGPSTAEIFARQKIYLTVGDPSRTLKIRQFRERLKVPKDDNGNIIDRPMMLIYNTCKQFIRTIPSIVTAKNDPEEIDTTGEDHVFDEVSHICMARPMALVFPKELKTLANRRLDMLEKGTQTPADEYEKHLLRHVAEQEQWVQGLDYDSMAPGETIGTISEY